MTISLSMRVSAVPDTLIQELDGESVLLNLASERYFGLDEVGTRMWQVLTTKSTIQAAHEALLSEYQVEGEVLRHDLLELVEKLVAHGLVAVSDTELD